MLRRPCGLVFLLSLVLAWMAVDRAGGELPARVASHFGTDGRADGWSERAAFLTLFGALIAGMSALLAGLAWMLPRLPVALVNLPHRDYWLASERRAVTWRRVQDLLLGIGAATNVFCVLVLHRTVVANRLPEPRLDGGFVVVIGAYALLVLGWGIWWALGWRRPRDD
jgi:hypothetical protein